MSDMWQAFNYSSLMAVLQATEEDAGGVFVPGELMPSGRPVRAVGATKKDLLNREMVEQWFNAVKGTYEREVEEANKPAVEDNVPDLVIRGEDTPAQQPGGGGGAALEVNEDIEKALQVYEEKLTAIYEGLNDQHDAIVRELEHTYTQLSRTKAARKAIAGDESEGNASRPAPENGIEVVPEVPRNSKKKRPAHGGGVGRPVPEL